MTKAGSTSKKWQDEIRHYMEEQRKRGQQQAAEAANAYEKARTGMVVLTLCALAGGLAFAWFIARSIVQPLQQAVALAGTVAAGDLTGHMEVENSDRSETAQMLRALDEMNGSLRRIVAEVRGGTETISTASAEIASGNMNLSERTEQQASALEETTASMEDLAGTVRKNADHAEQASQLSRSASLIAAEGGSAVGKVVTTMEAIDSSSKRIVEIISVIDAIAFQTNILALNAAVEAARAGEQGRGFAVVAGEVRTLAQRSAAAARDIKDLIGQSADQVNAGTRVVAEAGETMKEVVNAIERVNTLVHEIASASQEQRSGIDEVQRAVTEMDHATQQNAALVEEVAATATSLQEQTAHLARVVSTFKVDAADSRSPRLAARRAAQPRALPANAS
ncbi:HAMP domain-containing protein [Massilia arenosa]|uniref:HAMP domain-containing protein n=2 Tax=Zemynaea arenosa TaxID=2561931 RepID=A0A4Y9SUK5_9BURK|nr:HAMP domain-containing protein [Massilia arenosa]